VVRVFRGVGAAVGGEGGHCYRCFHGVDCWRGGGSVGGGQAVNEQHQSTTPEGDALAAIGWMLVAEASAEDPHNPWPRGCRYWHMHNKMWRRDRARQASAYA
jgi:hypothetical protein